MPRRNDCRYDRILSFGPRKKACSHRYSRLRGCPRNGRRRGAVAADPLGSGFPGPGRGACADHWRPADRRGRGRDRELVCAFRRRGHRDPRAVRPAQEAGGWRALPVRAEPDVRVRCGGHRRAGTPAWPAETLCGPGHRRRPGGRVRPAVRGAGTDPDVRRGLRGIPPQRPALAAQAHSVAARESGTAPGEG